MTIYLEEAHARDEWWLPHSPEASDKRCVYAHKTIEERLAAANKFVSETGFLMEMVCDTMEGNVTDRYRGWPERLYVIVDGVIVYQGGPGPFGYKLPEVKQFLADRYGMRGELILKTAARPSCVN